MKCHTRILKYSYRDPKELSPWQSAHAQDHRDFISRINSLAHVFGKPLLRQHQPVFYFGMVLDEVMKFLSYNDTEHKEIYRLINELGLEARPVFYVAPIFNMMTRPIVLDRDYFQRMFFSEGRVHMMTANAINLLYEALQG